MIVTYQPRSDYDITFRKPIVADMYVGNVPGPGCRVDVSLVSVVEIVIARNEKELRKRSRKFFQTL